MPNILNDNEADPPKQYFRWLQNTLIVILAIAFIFPVLIDRNRIRGANDISVAPEILVMQENSFLAVSPLYLPIGATYASLSGISVTVEDIDPCECGGNPKACNIEYGCIAGIGPLGFIRTTWNESLDRMTCSNEFDTEECYSVYLPEDCYEKILADEYGRPIISEERTEAVFTRRCSYIVGRWLLEQGELWRWAQSKACWDNSL